MSWPLSQDFNEAVQSPASSFADEELKTGEVALSPLGIPIPRSGNFADVYQVTTKDGRKWAVKCFTRKVTGLQERYARIDEHLSQARLPFTVRFNYLEQGIRVRGQWYPIVKMEWVEGFTLNEFVRDNLNKPVYLHALLQMWGKLCSRLRESGMAHADLQHGNVLLVPGATPNKLGLKLIDYDGMWVPSLSGRHSGEIGHPNYQHPLRLKEKLYTAEVDRFPHLVIATALRALLIGGKPLWEQFDNGDNLLFKETDLRDPSNSAVFKSLWSYRDKVLNALVGNLALSVGQSLEKTPWLDEILFAAKGPELSKLQEKQVAALLNAGSPSKSKTLPAVQRKEVQAEYNVFADLDLEGNDLPPAIPKTQRPELPSPRRTGPGRGLLWLGGAAVAMIFAVGFIVGMGGGSSPAPESKDKELVQADSRDEPKPPEKNDEPKPPEKPVEKIEDSKKDQPEVKKQPDAVAEVETVPAPRLVEEKSKNTLTEVVQTWNQLPTVYTGFEVSSDGKHLAAFDRAGRIEVRDAKTGESLKQWQLFRGGNQTLDAVSFGDEELLYVLRSKGNQQSLEEWTWSTGIQTKLDFDPFPVKEKTTGLRFLTKSQRLLTWGESPKLVLWGLNGKIDQELEQLNLPIQGVDVAADEREALIQWNGTRLQLFNLTRKLPTADFPIPPETKLERIVLSPTKQHVAAQAIVEGKPSVLIWEVASGKIFDQQETRFGGDFRFTADGNFLIGALDETHLGGIDLTRKAQLPPATPTQPVRALAIQPGENCLFSADGDKAIRLSKLTLPTPAVMAGMPKKDATKPGEGLLRTSTVLDGIVKEMIYTADGSKIIAGTRDGRVYTLDPQTLKDLDAFNAATNLIDMALTPKIGTGPNATPEQLLTLGDDHKIRLWNLKDSTQLKEFPSDRFFSKRNNQKLFVTPDGLAVLALDLNKFKAYDLKLKDAKEVAISPPSRGLIADLCFSPDGKLAMSIGDAKTILLLNAKTWKEQGTIEAGVDLRNLAYAPEAKLIVGTFRDTIRVIENAPKGKELHQLQHVGNVVDLALIPNQSRAVSMTRGNQPALRVWDLKTGDLLGKYDLPGNPQRIAVAPDGRHAVVCDGDKTVSLYGLPVGK